QVALQRLARALADAQLAQRLEVRQALEEQDALGQPVGVVHLLDRFLVLVLGQLLEPPVLQHLGVQEVLVDRGELVVQGLVEVLDVLRVAFHRVRAGAGDARTLARRGRRRGNANRVHRRPRAGEAKAACSSGRGRARARYSATRSAASGRQVPQVAPQPVRMVSSATLSQPASTASRIWRSVTPLQMQTYTAVSCG